MTGRPAKPIELHLLEGNPSRLSRAAIAQRQDTQIRIGTGELDAPDHVRRDADALRRWDEVVGEYRAAGVEFVTSSDAGHLARACQAHSEYLDLVRIRKRLSLSDENALTVADRHEYQAVAEEQVGEKRAGQLWETLEFLLSVEGLMKIDAAINAKLRVLTALEDRLFLNPLAKVKNVAKPKLQQDAPRGEAEMFG